MGLVSEQTPEADTYPMPEHGWTCFHCGATFTNVNLARDHFGHYPFAKPACQLAAKEVQAELTPVPLSGSEAARQFASVWPWPWRRPTISSRIRRNRTACSAWRGRWTSWRSSCWTSPAVLRLSRQRRINVCPTTPLERQSWNACCGGEPTPISCDAQVFWLMGLGPAIAPHWEVSPYQRHRFYRKFRDLSAAGRLSPEYRRGRFDERRDA